MYLPKIKWIITIIFIVLLIGIGFHEWIFLLSLLPLCITLVIYLFSFPPEELNLEVEREIEQTRFQEGEHVEILIKIRNKGPNSIDILEILDELPLQVSLKNSSNHMVTSLNYGEETKINYKISCDYRGRWKLGPTQIRARNFLSSACVVKTFENTITNIVVIPSFEPVKDIPFRTKYPKISEGPFHSKFKGEGLDFAGVREHVSSDSFNRINWLATAKYGRLFTNEFELFRTADLLLVLDVTEETSSILEEQIKMVLSLSEHFLKYKCRVGLIIIRDAVDRFELSSSRQQLLKFTEMLVDVNATKVENYSILSKRIKNSLEYYYPMNCLTIFISPLIQSSMNKIFIAIAKVRKNSFFLTPSIISSEWRFIKDKESGPNLLTHQNLLLKRQIEVGRIVQEGLLVFEWDVSVPFSIFMNKLKQVAVRRGRR